MKQLKRFGFATALLCVTSLLIAAFMVLFSYYGGSSTDKSKVNAQDKILVSGEPALRR